MKVLWKTEVHTGQGACVSDWRGYWGAIDRYKYAPVATQGPQRTQKPRHERQGSVVGAFSRRRRCYDLSQLNTPADATHTGRHDGPRARHVRTAEYKKRTVTACILPRPAGNDRARAEKAPPQATPHIPSFNIQSPPQGPGGPGGFRPPATFAPPPPRRRSRSSSVRPISPPKSPPALIAPLPTLQNLQQEWQALQSSPNPARRITWSKDVFTLVVDRTLASTGQAPDGPLHLSEPGLQRLADQAVDLIRTMANSSPAAQGQLLPAHLAEALYLRASFEASGSFPSVFPASPCDTFRDTFRDFEASARAGYAPACDYESVGDAARARD